MFKSRLSQSFPALYRCGRQVKRLGRLLTGRDTLYRYDVHPAKERLGTAYGGWTIIPDRLGPQSVVYSFGVGGDISFDLAMIERFGATIHGFDPSPEAVRFIARQRLPPHYFFHPYGLGTVDGELEFFVPQGDHAMYSLKGVSRHLGTSRILLAVKTLPTILSELNTRAVDVLKMDIEGAEYDQIDTLVANAVFIRQLLVEFHHRTGAAPLKETIRCVKRLQEAGFQLFHVSETSSEFSFLRVDS